MYGRALSTFHGQSGCVCGQEAESGTWRNAFQSRVYGSPWNLNRDWRKAGGDRKLSFCIWRWEVPDSRRKRRAFWESFRGILTSLSRDGTGTCSSDPHRRSSAGRSSGSDPPAKRGGNCKYCYDDWGQWTDSSFHCEKSGCGWLWFGGASGGESEICGEGESKRKESYYDWRWHQWFSGAVGSRCRHCNQWRRRACKGDCGHYNQCR